MVAPESAAAVRFRHLAVRLRGLLDAMTRRSFLVTSTVQGEGKTTVASNLAIALASIAPTSRIALVDLDLRCGRVAEVFGYETDVGIVDYLRGDLGLDQVAVRTDVPALEFLPVGRLTGDAHRLLGGYLGPMMDELHDRYDYVVCDAPPVLPVPDVPMIARHVGGCLTVVTSGRTRHKAYREMMDHLEGARLLGAFLNQNRQSSSSDRYGYYATPPVPAAPSETPSEAPVEDELLESEPE